jgi:hypothetical protein
MCEPTKLKPGSQDWAVFFLWSSFRTSAGDVRIFVIIFYGTSYELVSTKYCIATKVGIMGDFFSNLSVHPD